MEAAIDTERRKTLLGQAIEQAIRHNYRVESQTDFQAVFVKGKPINHVLHLLLTVFTFGLWAIIWVCVAIGGGEKREVVAVDEHGRTVRVG